MLSGTQSNHQQIAVASFFFSYDEEMAPILRNRWCVFTFRAEDAMDSFITKHREKVTGVISIFDRIIFKGHLFFRYPGAVEDFVARQGILLKDFKGFVKNRSEEIKANAMAMAQRAGRPYIYFNHGFRKEKEARRIARRDGITKGLICIFAVREQNRSFSLRYGENRPRLVSCNPPCLTLYFYIIDEHLGFIHIRLSTWLPYTMQVYINGHEWLARQLDRKGIGYEKIDNAFIRIENCMRAQKIADTFTHQKWEKILHCFARRVNPLLGKLLKGHEYYWVTDQTEFATDILFSDRAALKELYQNIQRHAAVCIRAEDIMQFLGTKLHGSFTGEVVTELKKRWPGARIKHRVRDNWIKMYDKFGIVLRVETVINDPHAFRIRRHGIRKGEKVIDWFPMAKRVTNLYRYEQICCAANTEYIAALAVVEDPSGAYNSLHRVSKPMHGEKKNARALNLLNPHDSALCRAVMRGENAINGFRLGDVADYLGIGQSSDAKERIRQRARLGRRLKLLHAHGLIRKIPHSRRYRVTQLGMQIMGAALYLYDHHMPQLIMKQAA